MTLTIRDPLQKAIYDCVLREENGERAGVESSPLLKGLKFLYGAHAQGRVDSLADIQRHQGKLDEGSGTGVDIDGAVAHIKEAMSVCP